MDEANWGTSVFIITCVSISLIMHIFIRTYWLGSVVSAALGTIIFQIFAYFNLGYLDPFFIIALIVGYFAALILSFIVGLPYFLLRRRKVEIGTNP